MADPQQYNRQRRRPYRDPFIVREMGYYIVDILNYIDVITQEPAQLVAGGTAAAEAAGTEPPATDPGGGVQSSSGSSSGVAASPSASTSSVAQAQAQTDVNTTLASQLASASVTQSPSDMSVETQSAGSSRPSVIVSDVPESHRQHSSTPRVIARDIVDLGNGQSVVMPSAADVQLGEQANRTSQKRKAEESEEFSEKAPSPKEPRNGEDQASVPLSSASAPEAGKSDEAAGGGGGGENGGQEDESRAQEEATQEEEEAAKDKVVQELMDFVLQYSMHYNYMPMPFALDRQLRKLPRAKIDTILKDLKVKEQRLVRGEFYSSIYSRGPPSRGKQVFSDEESDEELLKTEVSKRYYPTFRLTDEQQLTRCLIFGSPSQIRVARDSSLNTTLASLISLMIAQGAGEQVVDILKDISTRGRSSRQDTLLYCLALCCRSADLKTKHAAYAAIQEICRIPTHLFQFIDSIEKLGESSGWGRGLRKALRTWYNSNAANPLHLAMHVTKYWNRHGWCHRDLFRLSHIKPVNDSIGFIVRYCVKGLKEAEEEFLEDGYLGRVELEKVHKYLQAVEEVKRCEDVDRTLQLVEEHRLVREQLRTEMLNEPRVWGYMLPGMPLMALMRNLNKMTAIDLFKDPAKEELVVSKLLNTEAMKKARIHPLKLLLTHRMYQKGQGEKGSLKWTPNQKILEALEKAFYASFEDVEPTNKRIMIALDISSSMDINLPDYPFTVREAATVMAMVTIRKEPQCDVVGFHHRLMPLEMFKDTTKSLDQLTADTRKLGFGSTDCSKPMIWARRHKKEYDAFIIYTDSETNTHRVAPRVALTKYREVMKLPNTKLVVVGMTSRNFTISDPSDINSMDVVGFDPDTPEMIRAFLAGEYDL